MNDSFLTKINELEKKIKDYEKVLKYYANENKKFITRNERYSDLVFYEGIEDDRYTLNDCYYRIYSGYRANKILDKYKIQKFEGNKK